MVGREFEVDRPIEIARPRLRADDEAVHHWWTEASTTPPFMPTTPDVAVRPGTELGKIGGELASEAQSLP